MFNKTESILIYLSSTGLTIKDKDQERQVNFDPKTVSYSEIIDHPQYNEFIKQQLDLRSFFNKHVVILLEDTVLFIKEFVTLVNIEGDNLFSEYKNSIPLPLDKIEYRTSHLDGASKLYVINKELYEPIVKTLLNINSIIDGIYPKEGLVEKIRIKENIPQLDEEPLSKYIYKNKEHLEDINFNQQLTFTPRRIRIVTLILILILSLTITSVLLLNRNKQEKEQELINDINTTENTILIKQAQPVTEIEQLDAEMNIEKVNFADIKIKILNASGVAGEATKVKNLFIKAGNTNIEVGNEPKTNEGYTKVIYKNKRVLTSKEDILAPIKPYFSSFEEIEEIIEAPTEDVLIITGIAK